MKWEDKTRDGTPVKIFMEDRGDGAILGAILLEHGVWAWRVWKANGDMFLADKDKHLVPKVTKKTLYFNVYKTESRGLYSGRIWADLDKAKKALKDIENYLKTIAIEVTDDMSDAV